MDQPPPEEPIGHWWPLARLPGVKSVSPACRKRRLIGAACGEMKPLRLMSIHKSVCVTSFNDVLTEARGNIYADSTLISYVIWSPLSTVLWHFISDCISFFCVCVYLNFL